MMMSNKAATGYSRHVKRHLICSAASREQIHSRASALIEDFAEENPEARYADYVAAFGEPKIFAAEILSVLDEKEVAAAIRSQKCKRVIICIAITLVVILAIACLASELRHSNKIIENGPVYMVEKPIGDMTAEEIQKQFGK